ncbi:MAG: hypothetical protein ACFNLL_06210 [Bacteroides sp.]|jgi:hypothetical protein
MMLKTERRKIILERLEEVLKPLGYEREISQGNVTYRRFEKDTCDGFFLDFTTSFVTMRYLGHGLIEIASLLSEIDDNSELLSFSDTRKMRKTFTDPTFSGGGDFADGDDFSMKAKSWCGLDTPEIVHLYCDWLTNYFTREYPMIVEHYSYLPNILQKMNELDAKKIAWGNTVSEGILCCGFPYLCGLLISKLCNDPLFEQRYEHWEKSFLVDEYERYFPNYDRFRSIIAQLKPRYNV